MKMLAVPAGVKLNISSEGIRLTLPSYNSNHLHPTLHLIVQRTKDTALTTKQLPLPDNLFISPKAKPLQSALQ